MTKILLNDFPDCTFSDIYCHVMAIEDNAFEIEVKRDRICGREYEPCFTFDYYHMAWLGEKLAEVSTRFGYWVPGIYAAEEFTFIVEVEDKEALVDAIFLMIEAQVNLNSDEWGTVDVDALDFQSDVYNGNAVATCWGIHQVGLQLMLAF